MPGLRRRKVWVSRTPEELAILMLATAVYHPWRPLQHLASSSRLGSIVIGVQKRNLRSGGSNWAAWLRPWPAPSRLMGQAGQRICDPLDRCYDAQPAEQPGRQGDRGPEIGGIASTCAYEGVDYLLGVFGFLWGSGGLSTDHLMINVSSKTSAGRT